MINAASTGARDVMRNYDVMWIVLGQLEVGLNKLRGAKKEMLAEAWNGLEVYFEAYDASRYTFADMDEDSQEEILEELAETGQSVDDWEMYGLSENTTFEFAIELIGNDQFWLALGSEIRFSPVYPLETEWLERMLNSPFSRRATWVMDDKDGFRFNLTTFAALNPDQLRAALAQAFIDIDGVWCPPSSWDCGDVDGILHHAYMDRGGEDIRSYAPDRPTHDELISILDQLPQ